MVSLCIDLLFLVGSDMSPKKKVPTKSSVMEASHSGRKIKNEPNVAGATYGDTFGILDKEGETLKWEYVYQIFKK